MMMSGNKEQIADHFRNHLFQCNDSSESADTLNLRNEYIINPNDTGENKCQAKSDRSRNPFNDQTGTESSPSRPTMNQPQGSSLRSKSPPLFFPYGADADEFFKELTQSLPSDELYTDHSIAKVNLASPLTNGNRNTAGATLSALIQAGVNVNELDPVVVRRLKNTESARNGRRKKDGLVKRMEETILRQYAEIESLTVTVTVMRKEILDYKKVLCKEKAQLEDLQNYIMKIIACK